jgi:AraC-like DNA-binding protein
MDLLNHVLQTLKLLDSSLGVFELERPWGFSMGELPSGLALLYSPLAGRCWLQVDDETVMLDVGDVGLVLRGHPTFASAPDAPARPFLETWFDRQLPSLGPQVERGAPIRFAWPEAMRQAPDDRLLTVALLVEDAVQSPVLGVLPPLIVLRRETLEAGAWLAPLAHFVETERQRPQPGYDAIAKQLAGLLFIALLRTHVLATGTERASWMRGMGDAAIGQALTLMHARPGDDWRLPALARACGLSRSSFSRRFATLVGAAPMAYLAAVRLQAAASLLKDGQPVARVAEQVGYRTETAFRQAFVQHFGVTPMRHGRQAREGAA